MNYEVTEKIGRDIFRRKETSYKHLESSSEELAFDHFKILDYGVDRIRNKVWNVITDILPRLKENCY